MPPSQFVTTLAWTFIGVAGIGAAFGLIQAVMFWTLLQLPDIGLFAYFTKPLSFMVVTVPVLSVVMLAVAVGLLRRRRWAWLAFIVSLLLGLGLLLALYAGSYVMTPPALPASIPAAEAHEHSRQLADAIRGLRGLSAAFLVVLTPLFAWIVVRLSRATVRREFC